VKLRAFLRSAAFAGVIETSRCTRSGIIVTVRFSFTHRKEPPL
jgi:hypothetical protein